MSFPRDEAFATFCDKNKLPQSMRTLELRFGFDAGWDASEASKRVPEETTLRRCKIDGCKNWISTNGACSECIAVEEENNKAEELACHKCGGDLIGDQYGVIHCRKCELSQEHESKLITKCAVDHGDSPCSHNPLPNVKAALKDIL